MHGITLSSCTSNGCRRRSAILICILYVWPPKITSPIFRLGRSVQGDCSTLISHVYWQDFNLLREIGAVEMKPVLHEVYSEADAWDVLKERWSL